MYTEKHKMLRGDLYNALDPELVNERLRARLLLKQLNDSRGDQQELRQQVLKDLIPSQGDNLWIEPPFYCDYGGSISVGDKVYFNSTVLSWM